jgi:hypothetical protein
MPINGVNPQNDISAWRCTMSGRTHLLGTWKMVSWQHEVLATSQRTDVLGPQPVGYINYGSDSRVYAIVVGKDRPRPAKLPPTDEERVRLFSSMLAYAGTCTVDDEKVVHHIDASWNQTWTGTDQVRFYKLEGDKPIIWSAPAEDPYSGERGVYWIEFQKVRNPADELLPGGT